MRATGWSHGIAKHARAAVLGFAIAATATITGAYAQAGFDQSFSIVRTRPDAQIQFHGLTLKDARTDAAQNEIILRFEDAIDPDLFARLKTALPDWLAAAYGGQDSAVIRATRPVTFMTRATRDGFALRLIAAAPQEQADSELRGEVDTGPGEAETAGMQRDNTGEAFMLRGSELGGRWKSHAVLVVLKEKPLAQTQGLEDEAPEAEEGGSIDVGSHWKRPADGGHLVESELAAAIPLMDGLKLLAGVSDMDAKGKDVRLLDGTDDTVNENSISASLGVALSGDGLTGPSEARGEALWGKSGWGGRIGYAETMAQGSWGLTGEYHAPYEDTLEAVANHAYRDSAEFDFAERLARELWIDVALHTTRFGAEDDADIANTAGASASLRYLANLDGIWAGLTYEFSGDYVLNSHKYWGAAPKPFTPLDIRTFEVHALSGSLSRELARGFWVDAYGGYAIDRYGPDGYFAGGQLRLEMAPGWALSLGGGYSQVSTEQGERGPITSASLKLTYEMEAEEHDAAPKPLNRTYLGG